MFMVWNVSTENFNRSSPLPWNSALQYKTLNIPNYGIA